MLQEKYIDEFKKRYGSYLGDNTKRDMKTQAINDIYFGIKAGYIDASDLLLNLTSALLNRDHEESESEMRKYYREEAKCYAWLINLILAEGNKSKD